MALEELVEKLIKKCLGFEMHVSVYDPYVDERIVKSLGGKKIINFENGLKNADIYQLVFL